MTGGSHRKLPSTSSSTSRRNFRRGYKNNFRSSNSKPSPKAGIPSAPTPSRPLNLSPRSDDGVHSALPSHHFPDPPPAAPAYGFQMLERRRIVLADGTVMTYFALPPDYHDFSPLVHRENRGPHLGFDRQFQLIPDLRSKFQGNSPLHSRDHDYRDSLGLDGGNAMVQGHESPMTRKFWDDNGEADDGGLYRKKRQQLLQPVNEDRSSPGLSGLRTGREPEEVGTTEENEHPLKHHEVDQNDLKRAFFHFAKAVYECAKLKNRYLANGKEGHVRCTVCDRDSKYYSDTHSLIMHAYHSDNADSTVDHLGFHKALCVLMGWNYLIPPSGSKSYQLFSAKEASANVDDLIIWPPLVLIQNTITGKRGDGTVEGLGNKFMDQYLTERGFKGGKSKAAFNKGGHRGMTVVKFSSDRSGLKEAMRLAEYFQSSNRGRTNWALVQPLTLSPEEEDHPSLVKVDPVTREKKRIFYGYMANVSDLDKIELILRKRVTIESRTEVLLSQ
ncbi:unnamed protein product [Cuscuta campestris]|uniref:XS domain-containing protein n=1 Tax=Cuscuta campestris TaxID=132261 RepID=A0A484LTF0_9ASTE|nr:unnamed protein product [Cuscuta campestris]